jgi:inhibitor of cysteine peptidase
MNIRVFSIVTLAATAVVTLAVACTPDVGSSGEVSLTESQNGQAITLSPGQSLVVTLPANPTTGYSWTVTAPGTPQLKQDGEGVYTPDAGAAGRVGAGGTTVFRFVAVEAGATTLVLAYARPFEPDQPPAKTFSVPVTVK